MYADCKPISISVLRDVYVCQLRGGQSKKNKNKMYGAARSFLSCVKSFATFFPVEIVRSFSKQPGRLVSQQMIVSWKRKTHTKKKNQLCLVATAFRQFLFFFIYLLMMPPPFQAKPTWSSEKECRKLHRSRCVF